MEINNENSNSSNYFILECFRGETGASLTPPLLPEPLDNWLGGTRWEQQIPEPLEFLITDDNQGELRPFFQDAIPLMSDKLIESLEEVGVSNIDSYSVLIRNEVTREVHTNYKAVNIVGHIKGVNLQKSDAATMPIDESGLMDTFFHSLVLDEKAIGDHYLFRLVENISTIIVHRKVRDHLVKKGFNNLTFSVPQEEDDDDFDVDAFLTANQDDEDLGEDPDL